MSRSPRARRLARQRAKRQHALSGAPLSVLLLGRTSRNRHGGIGRSAQLIVEALGDAGDVCRLRNVAEPLTDIPSDTDLVWHYGDLDRIEQQIAAAREAGVPILINSTYDDRADRRRWLHDKIEQWDPESLGDVFFAVFSHGAEHDIRNHKIAHRLCAVPKTIDVRGANGVVHPAFEERSGICLGELEKLRRPRLVRGIDVDAAVKALREVVGGPLSVYDQYGTGHTSVPQGVEVTPKMGQRGEFFSYLASHRLFVSLVRHETFAMVPAEAQVVGTPVVYRHMPQSLSQHLGTTGIAFGGADQQLALAELVAVAANLYHDKKRWSAVATAGILNAQARGQRNVGAPLSLALRRVLVRATTRSR